jgi:hypothetical protein
MGITMLRRLSRRVSAFTAKLPAENIKELLKRSKSALEPPVESDKYASKSAQHRRQSAAPKGLTPPTTAPAAQSADVTQRTSVHLPPQIDAATSALAIRDGLKAARMALQECATHAQRFVVGHIDLEPTAEETCTYQHDGPIGVSFPAPSDELDAAFTTPLDLSKAPPRHGREPWTAEQALPRLIQVQTTQKRHDDLKADLADYTSQLAALEQRPRYKRVLRPTSKVPLQDTETLAYGPAPVIIARAQQQLSSSSADVEEIMRDPEMTRQAAKVANTMNALWKMAGFAQLHQRLNELTEQLTPAPVATPETAEVRRDSATESAPGATDTAQPAAASDSLSQWHADVTEYRAFLSQLEAYYGGNGLQRGAPNLRQELAIKVF